MPRFQEKTTETTLLWYDYETWGANPVRDGLAQFAAVRTDLQLNPIGDPINLLCKPNCDTVIDVDAVMITGLSPLVLAQDGISEWQFAHRIHQEMSVPGTCTVGYNSIRFDDECTRHLFYRNLIDPYAREWQNGNSRWDLLDVMRMMAALRPQGFNWPTHESGALSFKLEQLTAANGLAHENAHDAVSDVLATIALAKQVQQLQPKLFDYAFSLRSKHQVIKKIDLAGHTPHLHFTGKIAATEYCMGIEIPLFQVKGRANEVVVLDIREDVTWVLNYTAEQLSQWLYQKTVDLPEGIQRPPFRTIHLNKSPMVAPFSLLDDEVALRLGLNRPTILRNIEQAQHKLSAISSLASEMFTEVTYEQNTEIDAEHALYHGFITKHDRTILDQLQPSGLAPKDWLETTDDLLDSRLPELVENLVGRHFPEHLSPEQQLHWHEKVRQRLVTSEYGSPLTVEQALLKIEGLTEVLQQKSSVLDTKTYLKQLADTWLSPDNAKITEKASASKTVESTTNSDTPFQQLDMF